MIVMINDRFYNEPEIRQLIQSQAEQIRQLKKMLLQACSDFYYLGSHNTVECSHYMANGQICGNCPLNSDDCNECKWIYEPEALELIGGSAE